MGRPGNIYAPDAVVKMHLVYVPFVDGCYDRGGAYWGAPANLYHAWGWPQVGEVVLDAPQEVFVRANSREEAKAEVRQVFPRAYFWR